MGVINLGLLVDKIKRKLENSGFIKNTDYATASAAGVVKIGDNIDVTEAGVISVTFPEAGGFTVDTLWTGAVLNNEQTDITATLAHPISDYKFLAGYVGGTSGSGYSTAFLPVASIREGASVDNYIYFGNGMASHVTIRVNEGTVSISTSGGQKNNFVLLGIK